MAAIIADTQDKLAKSLGSQAAAGEICDNIDANTSKISYAKAIWAMTAFTSWQLDNDGARTNGGGIVGDVALTNAAAAFAKTYDFDESGGTWGNIAVSGARGGYGNNFQLFPDSPTAEDAVAFGAAVPFCELAVLTDTEGIYNEAGVLAWEYSDGAGSWASLTLVNDNTGTTGQTGVYFTEREGAITFIPPSDWESVALDGQTAYWIRAVVQTDKGDNMTVSPILNNVEHDIVTPDDGFLCPHDGTITGIRAIDTAGTLHSGTTVKFILMNFTTGAHSGELTWATSQRQDAWASLTLAVNAGDELGVLVTQEDSGNADPTNVMLELSVTPS